MGALSTRGDDPKAASRPFDKDRDGFVIGEGAGFMIVESYNRLLIVAQLYMDKCWIWSQW